MRVKMKSEEAAREWMQSRINDFPKMFPVGGIYFATDMGFTVYFDDIELTYRLDWGSQIIKVFASPVIRKNRSIKAIEKYESFEMVRNQLSVLRNSGEVLDDTLLEDTENHKLHDQIALQEILIQLRMWLDLGRKVLNRLPDDQKQAAEAALRSSGITTGLAEEKKI